MIDTNLIHEAIDKFILTNPTEEYHVKIEKDDRQRPYLGLSGLGGDYSKTHCLKATWLNWRHCTKPKFPGRVLRLFRDGDRAEYEFVFLLRGIGFEIFEIDETTGKQFSVNDYSGHLRGNLDAVAIVPDEFWLEGYEPHPILLEFKTANDRKFNECVKRGVEAWNPRYFSQMQGYQGYMNLKGGLFCVKNKNDSNLHFENVLSSERKFRKLVELGGDIISAQEPPDKIRGASPSFFICKFCEGYDICHKNASSQKLCRTCKFAVPVENAGWKCEKGREFGAVCEQWKDIAKV